MGPDKRAETPSELHLPGRGGALEDYSFSLRTHKNCDLLICGSRMIVRTVNATHSKRSARWAGGLYYIILWIRQA